ncbi:MAG: alpha/beta fold hydrolase [Proteobacteria bacterium]|nr:alpha/beta fold hydrolase [Pseudomonadota bacterium]
MILLDPDDVVLHRTGSGPPLVLLHCLGVDHRVWNFALELAQDFTLISYDLPGHGETPVPKRAYRVEDLSLQLARLLQRHGIDRAHVAGISLGGLVAQHFAAHHRDLIDRLVLIDTTPRYSDEMRMMWDRRAATARKEGVGPLVEDVMHAWFTDAFLAADPPAARYARARLKSTPADGYALACEALAAADLQADAARIRAPTLVVCGDGDTASFRDSARWFTANIKGARLEWLANGRHVGMLEHPDRTVALLRDFLRRVGRGQ